MERTKSTSRVIERTINIQEPTGRKNKKQKAGNTVLDGAKKNSMSRTEKNTENSTKQILRFWGVLRLEKFGATFDFLKKVASNLRRIWKQYAYLRCSTICNPRFPEVKML